jgi:hypothetical protein
MRNNITKVSKRTWYDLGGFARTGLFRRQRKNGAWEYFVDYDLFSLEK